MSNVMRHTYRELTATEKDQMQKVKDQGLAFYQLLHSIGHSELELGDKLASRELALAGTKIEEAVMWAVKHVTG